MRFAPGRRPLLRAEVGGEQAREVVLEREDPSVTVGDRLLRLNGTRLVVDDARGHANVIVDTLKTTMHVIPHVKGRRHLPKRRDRHRTGLDRSFAVQLGYTIPAYDDQVIEIAQGGGDGIRERSGEPVVRGTSRQVLEWQDDNARLALQGVGSRAARAKGCPGRASEADDDDRRDASCCPDHQARTRCWL